MTTTRTVDLRITVNGAEVTAEKVGRVADNLKDLRDNSNASSQGLTVVGTALTQLGSHLARTNQELGQIVSTFGQSLTLLPRMAREYGALGIAIGGAQTAFEVFSTIAQNQLAEQNRLVHTLTESYSTLIGQIRSTEQEQARLAGVLSGQGTREEARGERELAHRREILLSQAAGGNRGAIQALIQDGTLPAHILDAGNQLEGLRGNAHIDAGELALLAGETVGISNTIIETTRQRVEQAVAPLIQEARNRANAVDVEGQQGPIPVYGPAPGTGGANPHPRSGGGQSARDRERQLDEQYRRADYNMVQENARLEAEAQQHALDADQHLRDAQLETQRQVQEAHVREMEIERQAHERRWEQMSRERELIRQMYEERRQQAQEYTGPITNMFVGAITKTIAGTESAENAFRGLLSGFLELISQQAALKAAFEFAEAIATFPYGTAQHVAAGLAFTGVAIAAGVGSAVAAPPTIPAAAPGGAGGQAPASPGGGTTVIQWNSPIITVGNRAEIGRQVSQLTRQGAQQYGATV